MSERRVEYMPLATVEAAPRNPKRHASTDIERSIDRFGFVELPTLDERTGRLVAGHGRLDDIAARKRTGQDAPDGVRVDQTTGEWLVPVNRGWASRSDADAEAYVVTSNNLTTKGGWDNDGLAELLADLEAFDPALLEITGFDLADLEALQNAGDQATELPPALNDPDDAPEAPEEPRSTLGDLWILGKHRLLCGDSTSVDAIERLVGTDSVDMVFTDPPYGMSFGSGMRPGSPRTRVKMGMIQNDDLRGDALIALVRDALNSALPFRKPESPVYVCFTWRTYAEFLNALEQAAMKPKACIVWNKGSIGLGTLHYRPQHEFIFYVQGQWHGDKAQSDVWTLGRDRLTDYVHSTQKPVELIVKALSNSSKPGDVVLDLFGGSGSTLIACHQNGRTARLVELDPKYVDVICRRWQEHTGIVPELVMPDGTTQPVSFVDGPDD